MRKAVREAKEHTSWISPNAPFEEAIEKFIDGVLADSAFLADFEAFVSTLVWPGRFTSLSLVLLKLTAPGIPDTYQGAELWDLSLVDPDNRRPVDYELRRRLLSELDHLTPEQILERSDEGLPKLWTIRQTVRTRCTQAASFGPEAAYRALWPSGPKAAHLVAFQRGSNVITVAQRLLMSVGDWDSTVIEIPDGTWRNQLTGDVHAGGKVEIGAVLKRFPVALLTRESAQ
jgi:(1->4)-alpha-D-glucan 1-alpha-D-glucosylmutase